MGEVMEGFVRWLSDGLAPLSQAVADGVVWFIGQMDALVPLSMEAGRLLTALLFLSIPGIAMWAVIRLVSSGTARLLGKTDALITVFGFAAVLGFVAGGLLASGWQQPGPHIPVIAFMIIGMSTGTFFGSAGILGPRSAARAALILPVLALATQAFLLV